MQRLKLIEVGVISARHALAAHEELGQECHVETNENQSASNAADGLVVHAAKHLGPPVMETGKEGNHCSTHHHVMKVGHDKVGIVQVDVDAECTKEDSGQTADAKEQQKADRV